MKRLISRAMYHPLIALSMFYFIDLMYNVDYSPTSALLVLAAKSMSRVVNVFNKGAWWRFPHTLADAERPAVEDRNIRGFFLANKARDLRVQRVDSQMALAPRRPIAHWGCHKQEFHEIS